MWKNDEIDTLNHNVLWFEGKNWRKNQPIFALFYRCIGVKNGFGEDLEKNGRQKRRVWGKGSVAKYGTKYRVKKRNIHSRKIPANGYGTD